MTPRALALAVSVLVSLSAAAQLPRNEVAVSAGWTDLASVGGARALGASYSRFFTPNICAQLGAVRADGRGKELTDIHAAAEFHPFRESTLSPWAALGVARIAFRDSESLHSKLTSLVGAGVDVNLSRQFAIGAQVHYSPFVINPRERFGFNLNPMTLSLAARWRY